MTALSVYWYNTTPSSPARPHTGSSSCNPNETLLWFFFVDLPVRFQRLSVTTSTCATHTCHAHLRVSQRDAHTTPSPRYLRRRSQHEPLESWRKSPFRGAHAAAPGRSLHRSARRRAAECAATHTVAMAHELGHQPVLDAHANQWFSDAQGKAEAAVRPNRARTCNRFSMSHDGVAMPANTESIVSFAT